METNVGRPPPLGGWRGGSFNPGDPELGGLGLTTRTRNSIVRSMSSEWVMKLIAQGAKDSMPAADEGPSLADRHEVRCLMIKLSGGWIFSSRIDPSSHSIRSFRGSVLRSWPSGTSGATVSARRTMIRRVSGVLKVFVSVVVMR
jgi:hypothetical protein